MTTGRARKVGDNVSTDEIIAGRYLGNADRTVLAAHIFETLDPTMAARIRPGDVLVAGSNFGTGSSREEAPEALAAAGFACVVAASFARIFFRNGVNLGLTLVWSAEASQAIMDGDEIACDFDNDIIFDLTRKMQFEIGAGAAFVRQLSEAGGLIPYARTRLGGRLVPPSPSHS